MPETKVCAKLSPLDLVTEYTLGFEKKQRNLQKRKTKLDSYQDRQNKGEILPDDQKKALESYETVNQHVALVQDVIFQTNELAKLLESSIQREMEMEEQNRQKVLLERFSDYLYLYPIFNNLQFPKFRDLIIREMSEQQLFLLDRTKAAIYPIQFNQHVANAENNDQFEIIRKDESTTKSADNILQLINGSSKVIPLVINSGPLASIPKRLATFKNAQLTCLQLLHNIRIINFLNGILEPEEKLIETAESVEDISNKLIADTAKPNSLVVHSYESNESATSVSSTDIKDNGVGIDSDILRRGFNFMQPSQVDSINEVACVAKNVECASSNVHKINRVREEPKHEIPQNANLFVDNISTHLALVKSQDTFSPSPNNENCNDLGDQPDLNESNDQMRLENAYKNNSTESHKQSWADIIRVEPVCKTSVEPAKHFNQASDISQEHTTQFDELQNHHIPFHQTSDLPTVGYRRGSRGAQNGAYRSVQNRNGFGNGDVLSNKEYGLSRSPPTRGGGISRGNRRGIGGNTMYRQSASGRGRGNYRGAGQGQGDVPAYHQRNGVAQEGY